MHLAMPSAPRRARRRLISTIYKVSTKVMRSALSPPEAPPEPDVPWAPVPSSQSSRSMPPKLVGDSALEKSMSPDEVPEGVGICSKSVPMLP